MNISTSFSRAEYRSFFSLLIAWIFTLIYSNGCILDLIDVWTGNIIACMASESFTNRLLSILEILGCSYLLFFWILLPFGVLLLTHGYLKNYDRKIGFLLIIIAVMVIVAQFALLLLTDFSWWWILSTALLFKSMRRYVLLCLITQNNI